MMMNPGELKFDAPIFTPNPWFGLKFVSTATKTPAVVAVAVAQRSQPIPIPKPQDQERDDEGYYEDGDDEEGSPEVVGRLLGSLQKTIGHK